MIYIDDHWETVNDMCDIVRICRENICDEFANRVEEVLTKTIYETAIDYCLKMLDQEGEII